ncbi:acyl carrier protein [Ramlibacter tataouinensis]|uniref:acyl carrier protein n=1 Tax=Ramlibacter tataouinensis TaxID=94132 RepID=UPI0022F3ADF2|nr:acyl carrier protein [Ramlibacter tataouinensis]WBY03116.1 acyl carrier protein [Ramlibacter tataouinensis]
MTSLPHAQDTIRRVLREHGRLAVDADRLAADADLAQAGLTAHARLNVMFALEGEFEVEFPEPMIRRDVFRSIRSIESALRELIAA